MTKETREAIRTHLLADDTLKGLLPKATAVYYRVRPQDGETTYALFDKASGIEEMTFDGPAMKDQQWRVFGVCRGGDAAPAEAIDARAAELLDDVRLELPNGTMLTCYRVSDIDYGEEDSGTLIHYVGGQYRIAIQPT